MGAQQKKHAKRVVECPVCGTPHADEKGRPMCVGHKARDNTRRCGAYPIEGATVCTAHGGRIGAVQRKALERIQFAQTEGEVAALLRAADLPDQHPIDGLLEVVRHSGAMMRLLGHLVAGMKREPTFESFVVEGSGGSTRVEKVASNDALWGLNSQGDEVPSVLLALYEKWTTIYQRACKTALDANIDERLVRNAEQTSEVMFRAIGDALESGNLTIAQREAIVASLADSLRKYGPLELR